MYLVGELYSPVLGKYQRNGHGRSIGEFSRTAQGELEPDVAARRNERNLRLHS